MVSPIPLQVPRLPLLQNPVLVTYEDQGPVNTCALYFALNKLNISMVHFSDPYHRLWNDVKQAVKKSGLWLTVTMTTIAHNCAFGPWDNSKWWHAVKEAAADYFDLADASDPVFRAVLPRIFVDLGIVDCLEQDTAMPEVWERIKASSFLRVHGSRTATCRWFNWNESQEWWDEQWHSRLLLLLHLGIEDGFLNNQSLIDSAGNDEVEVRRHTGDDGDGVAADKLTLAQMRDRCKNTVHLATKIHCHDTYITRARMIVYVAKPLRTWYSDLAKNLRSRKDSLSFSIECAIGSEGLVPCAAVANIYKDLASLEKMGFVICEVASNSRYKGLQASDAICLHQDTKSKELVTLALQMIHERIWSMAHYTHAYPGLFALLLHRDDSVVQSALSKAKFHWGVWQNAKTNQMPTYKKMVRRSCFNLSFVTLVFEELVRTNFSLSAELRTLLKRVFSGFASTKLVEDGFQRMRDLESSRAAKTLTHASIWQQPVAKRLLEDSYSFREVRVPNIADDTVAAKKDALPASLYQPSYTTASMKSDFRKLPGFSMPST